MKLVILFACAVVAGCGGVSENGDGDGDGDGDTCAGTVDMDGNCVCPPREVPDDCSCADGWVDNTTGPCNDFDDDFNRSDLGPRYAPIQVAGAQEAVIVGNRICGDIQSVALLAEAIGSRNVSASLRFDPGGAEGQEVSFVLAADESLQSFFLVGCEGGGGTCNMTIVEFGSAPLAQQAMVNALPAQMLSDLEMSVDGSGNVSLQVTPADGSTVGQLGATLPPGFTVERIGLVIGRNPDAVLSCGDDWHVSVN